MNIIVPNWRAAAADSQLGKLRRRMEGESIRFTPNDVITMLDEFEFIYPGSDSGPGHIVIADYNLEVGNIAWCISQAVEAARGNDEGHTLAELLDLIEFFSALICLKEEERVVHGDEGYEFVDKSLPPFAPK